MSCSYQPCLWRSLQLPFLPFTLELSFHPETPVQRKHVVQLAYPLWIAPDSRGNLLRRKNRSKTVTFAYRYLLQLRLQKMFAFRANSSGWLRTWPRFCSMRWPSGSKQSDTPTLRAWWNGSSWKQGQGAARQLIWLTPATVHPPCSWKNKYARYLYSSLAPRFLAVAVNEERRQR